MSKHNKNGKAVLETVKSKPGETTFGNNVKKELISPADAQLYLLKNTINRPISDRAVKYLEQEISKGAWQLTTDAIGFDSNGNLINGQHRLTAVVRSGKTLEFYVARNLNPLAFNVIDTGKGRNAGDVLGANGVMASHAKSAIIRFAEGFRRGIYSADKAAKSDISMDNQEVLNYYNKYKDKLEESYDVSVQVTKEFKGIKGRTVGGMFYVLSILDREAALLFFSELGSGVGAKSKEEPIYLLRQKLMADMGAKKKFPEKDKLAWIIIAWNAFRKGKTMKQLRWSPDQEAFPKAL